MPEHAARFDRSAHPPEGAWDRLRRRMRPAAARPAAEGMLILASRHRLWQRYGPDGVFAVERAVGELVDALALRGLGGTLVYTDDSPLLARLAILPPDPDRPESVARLLRQVAARLAESGEQLRYVLILGDDGIVPFDRPANPVPDDEGPLASDQIYAADPDAPLRPLRAVGRIPDAGLGLLVGALHAAAEAHRRLAATARPRAEGAFGYSASIWKRAARGVFAALGDPAQLRLSPPLALGEAPRPGTGGPRLHYYNLHGLVDSPDWFGQRDPAYPADYDPFPVALRPSDLAPAPGSLVFSEACYGAHLAGRAVRDSIALTALAQGVTGLIGATGVAYGGLDGRLVAADLLAYRFWRALAAGKAAGEALAQAKRELVAEAMARQGYLDAEDEKAVLNFVLYGDPSLCYAAPSSLAEDAVAAGKGELAVESAGSVGLVGTPPARPHSPGGPVPEAVTGPALAAYVRQAVARRLPDFAGDDVRVLAMPAGPGVMPKAMGDGPGGPTVVTLSRDLLLAEGRRGHEVLRVTVDARGSIRKLTLSR